MFIKQISFDKYVNTNILNRFLLIQNVFEKHLISYSIDSKYSKSYQT